MSYWTRSKGSSAQTYCKNNNYEKMTVDELKYFMKKYGIHDRWLEGSGKGGAIVKHDRIKVLKSIINIEKENILKINNENVFEKYFGVNRFQIYCETFFINLDTHRQLSIILIKNTTNFEYYCDCDEHSSSCHCENERKTQICYDKIKRAWFVEVFDFLTGKIVREKTYRSEYYNEMRNKVLRIYFTKWWSKISFIRELFQNRDILKIQYRILLNFLELNPMRAFQKFD